MSFDNLKKEVNLQPIIYLNEITRKDGFYVTWRIGGLITISATTRYLAADSTQYGDIFIAKNPCEVLWVAITYTDNDSANLDVEKLKAGVAKGSGSSVLAADFVLTGTANTASVKSGNDLSATLANRRLDTGDRLGLDMTGTLTGLRNVCVTVYLKPLGRGNYK